MFLKIFKFVDNYFKKEIEIDLRYETIKDIISTHKSKRIEISEINDKVIDVDFSFKSDLSNKTFKHMNMKIYSINSKNSSLLTFRYNKHVFLFNLLFAFSLDSMLFVNYIFSFDIYVLIFILSIILIIYLSRFYKYSEPKAIINFINSKLKS